MRYSALHVETKILLDQYSIIRAQKFDYHLNVSITIRSYNFTSSIFKVRCNYTRCIVYHFYKCRTSHFLNVKIPRRIQCSIYILLILKKNRDIWNTFYRKTHKICLKLTRFNSGIYAIINFLTICTYIDYCELLVIFNIWFAVLL